MRRIDVKECNECGEEKTLEEFYSQNKTNKNGNSYTYYNPKCKDCVKENVQIWRDTNRERFREWDNNYAKTPKRKETLRKISINQKLKGNERRWRQNNKDKLKLYAQRYNSKKHNISEEEWDRCKKYFNHECAYCGMSEEAHRLTYKQQLHKEHVIHDGREDIKNCVPSCKSCNSSKRTSTLNQWYNVEHPNYSRERYLKIYYWMRYDCKNSNAI
ncbi:HNH endonuclease [Siminovitchia sp. 179-K 8D1 HS]|uniref:HNH endonuclease n=1 Tax=Siminovitchia sp. 179-K 8D1 HS TaxID=3142385 RepID=UPI0039A2ECE1